MELRTEQHTDHAAVRTLHQRAFGDHGTVVAALLGPLRELIAAHGGLSLVAEVDGAVVGHVMFSRAVLDAPRRLVDVRVLSPLAVAPDQQRQGIGSALIVDGLRIMAERNVPLVFLEGSPDYYARSGFTAGGGRGFRKPSLRTPDAAFQVFLLSAYEPWMTGTLVYPSLFWEHDAVGLRDPDTSAW
jgi:putative acetyltransferase